MLRIWWVQQVSTVNQRQLACVINDVRIRYHGQVLESLIDYRGSRAARQSNYIIILRKPKKYCLKYTLYIGDSMTDLFLYVNIIKKIIYRIMDNITGWATPVSQFQSMIKCSIIWMCSFVVRAIHNECDIFSFPPEAIQTSLCFQWVCVFVFDRSCVYVCVINLYFISCPDKNVVYDTCEFIV